MSPLEASDSVSVSDSLPLLCSSSTTATSMLPEELPASIVSVPLVAVVCGSVRRRVVDRQLAACRAAERYGEREDRAVAFLDFSLGDRDPDRAPDGVRRRVVEHPPVGGADGAVVVAIGGLGQRDRDVARSGGSGPAWSSSGCCPASCAFAWLILPPLMVNALSRLRLYPASTCWLNSRSKVNSLLSSFSSGISVKVALIGPAAVPRRVAVTLRLSGCVGLPWSVSLHTGRWRCSRSSRAR